MGQKSVSPKEPAETVVRDIRRRTRKQYSAEEKIRIRNSRRFPDAPCSYPIETQRCEAEKSLFLHYLSQ